MKDARVSVRISALFDDWLRRRVGSTRSKSDVVRELIEAEIAREEAARLTKMFDAAAAELTDEDRGERDLLLDAFRP
jgi:Arc/MetJ-type ribon-helix-helix transcriptional regulator